MPVKHEIELYTLAEVRENEKLYKEVQHNYWSDGAANMEFEIALDTLRDIWKDELDKLPWVMDYTITAISDSYNRYSTGFAGHANIREWLKSHKLSNKYRFLFTHGEMCAVRFNNFNARGWYTHAMEIDFDPPYYYEDDEQSKLLEQFSGVEKLLIADLCKRVTEYTETLQKTYDYIMFEDEAMDGYYENALFDEHGTVYWQ